MTLAIFFLSGGQLFVFVLAAYFSYNCIALTYFACGFITVLSTVLLMEPPQSLLMDGNTEKAEKNFARLRDMNDPHAVTEFQAMKKNVEEERLKKFNLSQYATKEVCKSFRIILIFTALYAGCGFGPVSTFVTTMFSNSSVFSANQLSIFYALLQVICTGATSTIVDRVGRRCLILITNVIVTVIHIGIVALYCIQYTYEIPCFHLILCIMLTMYACLSLMFQAPLLSLIRGELLPQKVRMMGSGFSTVVISLVYFIQIHTFLFIAEKLGIEYNFVMYSCSALLSVVYLYFELPETRGKTLVEIQDDLKSAKDGKPEISRL